MSKKTSKKIDGPAIKKAAPFAVLRLLPVGALFLPLGTLTFSLGGLGEALGLGDLSGLLSGLLGGALGGSGGSGTSYNIVGLIKGITGRDSDLMVRLLKTDMMATPRVWLYVTGAGLILSILAMLAGLAFIFAEKKKPLAIGAAVYGAGTLGGIGAIVGFIKFGEALGPAIMNLASAAVNYGAYVLAAMLLLNLIVCLAQWRGAREQVRLTALARQQKKKKR